jgi:hypothetical protein
MSWVGTPVERHHQALRYGGTDQLMRDEKAGCTESTNRDQEEHQAVT